MIPTLEEILARVDEPETPVVWLDPSIPENYWDQLPARLAARGYRVVDLDGEGAIEDLNGLHARVAAVAELPEAPGQSFEGLRQTLVSLAEGSGQDWVMLYRNPGPLRSAHEAGFEELIEVLESVHETCGASTGKTFKLVVKD